jgi:ABC-type uncharacterized transport system substrate-binding protein
MRMFAKELVALQPNVILAFGTPATAALLRETRKIPIVFAIVSDPVGEGFVASLAHPGGNITGFLHLEASIAGKWLELLQQIAPGLKRAAMIFRHFRRRPSTGYDAPSAYGGRDEEALQNRRQTDQGAALKDARAETP